MKMTIWLSGTNISRWWVLVLSYLCMLAFAVTLQMIPPIIPRLVTDAGMTHAGAGALMGIFTLPGIFIALPGGRISDLVGPRIMGLLSLVFIAAGTFLMLPMNPVFLFTGRLCSGIGAGVLAVIAPQIVVQYFYNREIGIAMGIFNTAVPFGSIVAFNGLGYLNGRFGIPAVILTASAFSLLALTAFGLTYRDLPRENGDNASDHSHFPTGLGAGIWLVATVWTLFNIGILAYFTYSIDHFTVAGIIPSKARFLGSFPMLVSIFLAPPMGIIIGRTGYRWSMVSAGCLLSSLSIAVLARSSSFLLFWSFIAGLGIAMVAPAVFTLAGEVVPSSRTGTGYGILTTLFNVGTFLGIPLVGFARDITADYVAAFGLMVAFLLVGSILAIVTGRMLSER